MERFDNYFQNMGKYTFSVKDSKGNHSIKNNTKKILENGLRKYQVGKIVVLVKILYQNIFKCKHQCPVIV